MFGFRFEPALISEAVRQVLLMLILFQVVSWTDQQVAAVLMVVSAVLALFTRQVVVPVATIDQSDTTVGTIKAQARANTTLMLLVLVLGLGASASGCALNASRGKQLQQVDLAVYTAISAVDDIEMTLYKTGVLTEATHARLNPVMLTTLKAGRAANDALIAWPRGDAKPPLPEFAAALDALNQLAKAVVDFTPDGPARDQLKSRIDLAVQLVRGIMIGIGGAS